MFLWFCWFGKTRLIHNSKIPTKQYKVHLNNVTNESREGNEVHLVFIEYKT